MIEFGAGGNIVHNDPEPSTATAGEGSGNATSNGNEGENTNGESTNGETANGEGAAEGSAGPTPQVVPPTPAEARRRKRRAKGWFCPVCRQRKSFSSFSLQFFAVGTRINETNG